MTTTTISYRLTQPFHIEAVEQELKRVRAGDALVRPRVTGVCASDLKLYAGTRDRAALSRKLPLALLHEGIGEVIEPGTGAGALRPGTRVAVVPNIPCYIAHPERFPTKDDACPACRPGGAGENYCLHHLFLSSNTDGMAQSGFSHPDSLIVPVPHEVPDRIAALAEPLTTILAGCEKAPIVPGRRYLILGNGPIGLLAAVCLTGFYGIPRDAICMTGHDWENRREFAGLVGQVLDSEDRAGFDALCGEIDVAFECVGGDGNAATLEQAVNCLKPGGTAVLFGPSEKSVLFNTREMIGKGLSFVGANRSFVRHFRTVLDRMRDPEVQRQLSVVLAPAEYAVRTADDLNRALYQAWTKRYSGKTVIAWAGPE